MASPSPAIDFKNYQDRKLMSEDNSNENYTKVPNAVLNCLMAKIKSMSELKVIFAIVRQTNGYQKKTDVISISQFEKLTGLTRQGVINGVALALKHGYITREPSGQSWNYTLQLVNRIDYLNEATSQQNGLEVVNEIDQQLVNRLDTQKKDLNKTLNKIPTPNGVGAAPAFQVVKSFEDEEKDPTPSSRQVEAKQTVPVSSNGRERSGAGESCITKPKIHIPPVPEPVPKKHSKELDLALLDPRMQMWRKYADLAGYGPWPNELQRQMIMDQVPVERLGRWENILKYWVAHGWQVKNIDGLLDAFVNGVKKRGGASGRG
jgi:phage replication O-like protein O